MKGKIMETLKAIGLILTVFATIGFFWAMAWFMCLLNNSCYYNNFPGAL